MYKSWRLYSFCLIAALALEVLITINIMILRDQVSFALSAMFGEESIYATELFANAVFRSLLAILISSAIIFPAIYINKHNCLLIKEYFHIRLTPSLILCAVFLYLNSHSENAVSYLYALISFMSLILVVSREHVLFFTQAWFSRINKDVYVSAFFSIIIFILLHPLVFTEGRILGTLLMVNLWIYTVAERNMWMGISVHTAWNFIVSDSESFYYLVFLFSCFLAFGRPQYPEFLLEPFRDRNQTFQFFFRIWRGIWCFPERLWGGVVRGLHS